MEIFDYYPIPHPYDVKERVNNGFRLPYDLQDEIRLLFPKGKIKKKLNILIIYAHLLLAILPLLFKLWTPAPDVY